MNPRWQHPKISEAAAVFTAWAQAQMAYRDLPGLAVGVVYNQEVVWAAGIGHPDYGQSPNPRSLFRVASITKLFTATAVMQLQQQGLLDLDAPIERYLPHLPLQGLQSYGPVSLRQLLSHTAGLPREAAFPYWTDSQFPNYQQWWPMLAQQSAVWAPNQRFKYSNLGYALAGNVIEAVSGQSYESYVQASILSPLGMSDSVIQNLEAHHPLLMPGYGRWLPQAGRQSSPFSNTQGLTAAAGLASNVQDLARFAMLHLGHFPQVLGAEALRQMQHPVWLDSQWQSGWGLGFSLVHRFGKTYVGHGGALLGYRTQLSVCPADQIAVITLCNADDSNPLQFEEKLYTWVVPAIQSVLGGAAQVQAPDYLQLYVGKYRSAWGDTEVLIQDGGLVTFSPNLPDPTPSWARLLQEAPHTFRIESPNGFGSPGETLRFVLNTHGQAVAIEAGQGRNRSERVERW